VNSGIVAAIVEGMKGVWESKWAVLAYVSGAAGTVFWLLLFAYQPLIVLPLTLVVIVFFILWAYGADRLERRRRGYIDQ
jgi:Flp pilus assembly protein TadB